jgi:hypothetical protein
MLGRTAHYSTSCSTRLSRARSAIDGFGVFTKTNIPAGVVVLQCGGIIVHSDQVRDGMRVMQVGPDSYLAEDPAIPRIDDFLNHSCEPNLGFVTGSLELFSLRRIKTGEELLFDYSTCMNERGWSISCRCGERTCRRRVNSYCELPQTQKRRLERIALSYLRPAGRP